MAGPGLAARRVAFDVISAVTSRDAYANLLLAAALRRHGLSGRDAALATELVYGTLRGRGQYDAIIAACADREPAAIDDEVLDLLRLGAHQILGMRTPPHAAVATAVDLAVQAAGRRRASFVNAVLRRVATHDLASWLQIVAPDRAADPVGHLSVRYSHPRWIVAAIAEALGDQPPGALAETERALAADRQPPGVTLAAVPGLSDAAELAAAGAAPARWSPYGAHLAGEPGAVPALAQGRAGVQDEASQLAVLALARAASAAGAAGGRWLDLCAGPGGKARLLAGLAAQAGAFLVAADVRAHRARLVARALAPLVASRAPAGDRGPAGRPGGAGGAGGAAGVPGAAAWRVLVADGTRPAWRPGIFDLVLADVPCSGLGSLRRRPEARWRRRPEDVAALGGLQRALLAAAIRSARPGGVVAYVTCSPHVAETRSVVGDVLAGHRGVEVLDAPGCLPEVPGLRCPGPHQRYAQFWPHRHGTDAIFVALLRVRARGGG